MQIDRLSATCIWDAVSGNAGSCGSATFVFLHQVLSWRWELRLRPSDPTKHEKTTTEPQHTPATLRYACVRDDTPFAPLLPGEGDLKGCPALKVRPAEANELPAYRAASVRSGAPPGDGSCQLQPLLRSSVSATAPST